MPFKDPLKQAEYWKEYARKNRVKKQAYSKAYQENNKERIKTRRAATYRKNPETAKAKAKEWYARHKQRALDGMAVRSLRTRYGLELPEFIAMIEAQNGKCAICQQEAKLCVDHDHASGKIRQLLCLGCNGKLGAVENAAWLAEARWYLQKHKELSRALS